MFYAAYLIVINKSVLRDMDNTKLTFYVLLFCALTLSAACALAGVTPQIGCASNYFNLAMLAFICTVLANVLLVAGIKRVGPVIVSIMGALSPFTAVVVGVLVFGEVITRSIFTGLVLVFASVILSVFAGQLDGHFKGFINRMTSHLGVKIK